MSTCPQVGSMFNEGIGNAQTKTWDGSAIPRTMEGDEAHYTAFLLGAPSLQAAGCNMQRILQLPRARIVLCILHVKMAMGRLLGEVVNRETRGVFAPPKPQGSPVAEACKLEHVQLNPPDGEETANFFEAWPDIARCLGIGPSRAKYKAITNMWDLLQGLYYTYQGPNLLKCAGVAKDFRRYCTIRMASWYLLSLEQNVNAMS